MPKENFATQDQVDDMEAALESWEETFPEAAKELKVIWKEHLSKVGHKRLGRALIGREVLPWGVK